jgi:hypothetical protein
MPFLFWLPAIIVCGLWSTLMDQRTHRVADQSDDELSVGTLNDELPS